MSSEYARAMQKEQERLEKARKRNAAEALANGGGDDDDDGDALEAAWDGVFERGQQSAADGADDARRRKAQKKSEKQREKRAAEAANAGQCTAYVTGIPKEVGFTAVQNLFAKVGAVRRVKLYKDERGEQKGDGIVTFAKEEGLAAALAKDDWQIFGDALTVTRAAFAERPEATAKNDWSRIAVIKGIFATEEIGASGDAKAYIANLEDEVRPRNYCRNSAQFSHELSIASAGVARVPPLRRRRARRRLRRRPRVPRRRPLRRRRRRRRVHCGDGRPLVQ